MIAADLPSLAQRLLTLGIDTIVSDSISVERMPLDGQALIRLAQRYKEFLCRVVDETRAAGSAVADLPTFQDEGGRRVEFDLWDVHTGGLRTYAALRQAAQVCQRARAAVPPPHGLRSEHEAILARVVGFSGEIATILRRMGLKDAGIDEAAVAWSEETGAAWPAFDRDALLALRRIWEIGVDVVVMQTLVRLDGGVTTRVLDGWDGAAAAPIRDLHYRAVDISLARWSVLVQTAKDLAGLFLGGGSGDGGSARPTARVLAVFARRRSPTAAPAGYTGLPGAAP